jgi:hypothetical protein
MVGKTAKVFRPGSIQSLDKSDTSGRTLCQKFVYLDQTL